MTSTWGLPKEITTKQSANKNTAKTQQNHSRNKHNKHLGTSQRNHDKTKRHTTNTQQKYSKNTAKTQQNYRTTTPRANRKQRKNTTFRAPQKKMQSRSPHTKKFCGPQVKVLISVFTSFIQIYYLNEHLCFLYANHKCKKHKKK